MAKRKRLMPAQASYLAADAAPAATSPGPLGAGAAPIAQVASEASASAALEELSGVLEHARSNGLMIEELPLDAIDETYLVRDRITQDEEEMQALMASLASRGQQTPIEVVRVEGGARPYGLISGWRRLDGLRRLYDAGSEPRFAQIKARVIAPEGAEAAYVSMVEENEIRVNLSHYERARIALKAQEMGLYEDLRKAILGLFGNASRTKRSKIASFAVLVAGLDAALTYPTAISEKLGLGLAQRLEQEPGFGDALRGVLSRAQIWNARDELEVLQAALDTDPAAEKITIDDPALMHPSEPHFAPAAPVPSAQPRRETPPTSASEKPAWDMVAPGIKLAFAADRSRIELAGDAVDAALLDELKAWLRQR